MPLMTPTTGMTSVLIENTVTETWVAALVVTEVADRPPTTGATQPGGAGMLTPDGGESREALRGRVNEALATILGDSRTWLVVSHGGPIRMAIEVLLGVPVGRLSPVTPASATVIDLDDPRLLAYNLTPRHAPGDVP